MGNGYYEKVDRLMAGWKPDPYQDIKLLCRVEARVTPLYPNVKGIMNDFTTPDIFSPKLNGLYTEFEIAPK